MKFITGEDLELWYRDKIKGTVRPEVEFDEALQAFYKEVHYREIFDELEVRRVSTRTIYNASSKLVIKNKLTIPSDVSRKF